MRVLALTNLYPNPLQPHRAPYNRHQFRMLAELHPTRVIAPIAWLDEWRSGRAAPPLPADRRCERDGLIVDHPRYWYTPKVFRQYYGRFFWNSVRETFLRVVAEFRPDVVFAPWAYPDGYAAVQLGREAKLPVVVQVHGSDIRQLDQYPARQAGTASAVRDARGVIAVCRDLAGGVMALGAAADRVRVVVDGVDRSVFSPGSRSAARVRLGLSDDVRHLLFVGNLVRVKGLDVLLEACRWLVTDAGPWHLHLVGEGSERPALIRQAAAVGIAHRITFHGAVPHERLPDWFRAANLLVLASRSEGIPNVLLEAMACGLPFVATSVGGIPEIADPASCRLVPPERPLELAKAMTSLLADPPRSVAAPRDRREAVAEIADFLETCAS
jgi:glycosyltransferase involved in cell wall biosynthesis